MKSGVSRDLVTSAAVLVLTILTITAKSSGAPLFVLPVNYAWYGGVNTLAVGDVNGDGNLDLVMTNCGSFCGLIHGSVGVRLGNGDGTFGPLTVFDSGGGLPISVAVADVNGDGKPDIIVANEWINAPSNENGSVGVLLGNGDGTFQPVVTYASGGTTAGQVVVADLNGDGKPDLAVANCGPTGWAQCPGPQSGDAEIGILLGNGDGTFRTVVTYDAGVVDINSLAVADVNGDGKPDLVTAGSLPGGYDDVSVLLGKGDGTFQSPETYYAGLANALSVTVADLNRDGKLDVAVGGAGYVWVLLGNGDGTFGPPTRYGTGSDFVESMTVADVNDDGKLDLVLANYNGSNGGGVGVLLGNGDGTFQTELYSYPASKTPVTGVAVVDLIRDGRPELLSAGSTGVSVMLNNTAPYWTQAWTYTSGSPSYAGQPVTFREQLLGPPDGELVIFYDGTTTLGKGVTAAHAVTFTTSSLKAGTHSIRAIYPGDANWTPYSGHVSQVITPYPTTTTMATSPNPSNYGQSVILTAQVTVTSSTSPTGTVTFKNGTTSLGAARVNASGVAILSNKTVPVGSDSVTATYNGDAVNGKSTSPAVPQTVNQAQTTMTLISSLNPSKQGQSVKFTATLISNGGLPNGQPVTFSYKGNPLGTGTISGGKAAFLTTTLPVGSDVVTGTYAGDSNHSSATASVTQAVN